MCAQSLQSCLTLCDPVDSGLPGSFFHGILQARILESVSRLSSRRSSRPGDRTCVSYVSCIGRRVLYPMSHQGSPVQPSLLSNCTIFSLSQKETLYPLAVTPHHFFLQSLTMTLCFSFCLSLYLYICLFWTFHGSGNMQYIALCFWLLFLSIMFVRLILWHVSVLHSFYGWMVFHCIAVPHFVSPSIN